MMGRLQGGRMRCRAGGTAARRCLGGWCLLILLQGPAAVPVLSIPILHSAVYRLDLGGIERLLRQGADVNHRDSDGKTPLFYCLYAVEGSRTAARDRIIARLVARGANVNAADRNGITPLMEALSYGSIGPARMLLRQGASVEDRDMNGSTPLHRACGVAGVDFVSLLVERGGGVNWRDRGGWTPLHEAAEHGNSPVVAYLIGRGADVLAENEEKNTPLHLAALEENVQSVRDLVAAGAPLDARNLDGNTPLHLAVHERGEEIVSLLLSGGAPIDLQNNDGLTPLHRAAFLGLEGIAGLLMARGSRTDLVNAQGYTPLHLAVQWDHGETVRLLARKGGAAAMKASPQHEGMTPLHLAARYGRTAAAQLLLEGGAVIHQKDLRGKTPLDRAIESAKLETANLLAAYPFRDEPFYFVLRAAPEKGEYFATSRHRDSGRRGFGPEKAFDGKAVTGWVTGRDGGPEGERIAFFSPGPFGALRITTVGATSPRPLRGTRGIRVLRLRIYRAERADFAREGINFRIGERIAVQELIFAGNAGSRKFAVEGDAAGVAGGRLAVLEILEVYRGAGRYACIAEISPIP
ncbi:MAG: ankyrin repeat domain-containing protein [Spirochaetes bacterium]|nr:ankyrin repeat domain-containing protein [Spirochaetota bacterium]